MYESLLFSKIFYVIGILLDFLRHKNVLRDRTAADWKILLTRPVTVEKFRKRDFSSEQGLSTFHVKHFIISVFFCV